MIDCIKPCVSADPHLIFILFLRKATLEPSQRFSLCCSPTCEKKQSSLARTLSQKNTLSSNSAEECSGQQNKSLSELDHHFCLFAACRVIVFPSSFFLHHHCFVRSTSGSDKPAPSYCSDGRYWCSLYSFLGPFHRSVISRCYHKPVTTTTIFHRPL